jgi:hypothetical protein
MVRAIRLDEAGSLSDEQRRSMYVGETERRGTSVERVSELDQLIGGRYVNVVVGVEIEHDCPDRVFRFPD